MKLVIHPPRGPEWLTPLRTCAPGVEIVEAEEPTVLEAIRTADAFYGRIQPEWLAAASKLRISNSACSRNVRVRASPASASSASSQVQHSASGFTASS